MTTPESRTVELLALVLHKTRGSNDDYEYDIQGARNRAVRVLAAAKEHGLVIGEGEEYRHRIARVVARLPRMLTEADDYSWVPLGDVFIAIADVETAELVWPKGGERMVLDTLRRHALECSPLKEISESRR